MRRGCVDGVGARTTMRSVLGRWAKSERLGDEEEGEGDLE